MTLIGEAVFSRCLSALKEERARASKQLAGPSTKASVADRKQFLTHIRNALYCAKIVSYAQGFMLLREAANEYKWNLNYGGIALMWRGGCIIRSVFLGNIRDAFVRNPQLSNLLLDDFFKKAMMDNQQSWREVVSQAVLWGVPVPALSAALAFFDGYRSSGCRQICSRHSVTTSVRIPTSCSARRANLFIPTGPARVAMCPPVLIWPKTLCLSV